MKKIIIYIFSLSFVVSLFAKSYDELIKSGEDFENKKQWIYALGAYYDAMQIAEDSEIAKQKYDELSDCIKNGNPGFGTFNVFSMHDEWVNLIKNAEQYFTKTFPYKITYENEDLKMDSADYENRTANYKLALKVEQTDLYKDVLEILKTGYSKTDHKDWTDLEAEYKSLWFNSPGIAVLEHSSWNGSLVSIVNFWRESAFNTKYEKLNKVTEYPILQKETHSTYQKNGVALSYLASVIVPYTTSYSYLTGISICEVPAFAACFSETISTYNGHNDDFRFMLPFFTWGKQTCYDLKLAIYDENDSLILDGTRQTVCTWDFSYLFTKIPQEKLSFLDSKKYKIKLLGIWLNYGVYDISLMTDDDIKNGTIRGIVKPLPDIKIQTENVEFIDTIEQQRLEAEKKAKEAEEKRKIEEEWKRKFEEEMKIQQKRAEERTEILNIIEEKIKNYGYVRLQSSQDFFENMGISFSLENPFEVDFVDKNTPASRAKIKSGFILQTINGIEIKELKEIATNNFKTYEELLNLAYNKCPLAADSDFDIKIGNVKDSLEKLSLTDCLLLYYDTYYIKPLPAGTVLKFEDPNGKKKPVELIIP